MKKSISMIIVFVIVMSLFTVMPISASAQTEGYYTYTVSNGEATIIDVDENISGDITIPSTLGGYPVTAIGNRAFWYSSRLDSIKIPNSVKTIGNFAFEYCSLKAIVIGNSVTEIGEGAFSVCYNMTSVEIPDSVTKIGDNVFLACDKLMNINVAENNNNYCSSNGVLFNKDKTAILCYPSGKTDISYTIPDDVTTIGKYAFYMCNNLTRIDNFKGIITIDDSAFYGCYNITTISIPESVTTIGKQAFGECRGLVNIEIADSVAIIGERTFEGCTSLENIMVSENNENYCSDNGVLFNKNKTTLICYPIGKTEGKYIIPDGVINIGGYAFRNCDNLKTLRFSENATHIGEYAFYDCDKLITVSFSGNVVHIGKYAFSSCNNLRFVYYSGNVEQWDNIDIDTGNSSIKKANKIIEEKIEMDNEDEPISVFFVTFNKPKIVLDIVHKTIKETQEEKVFIDSKTEKYKILYWENLAKLKPICEPKEKAFVVDGSETHRPSGGTGGIVKPSPLPPIDYKEENAEIINSLHSTIKFLTETTFEEKGQEIVDVILDVCDDLLEKSSDTLLTNEYLRTTYKEQKKQSQTFLDTMTEYEQSDFVSKIIFEVDDMAYEFILDFFFPEE